jgi:hypothetical protein
MSYLPNELRQQVVERAKNHCEYCGLSQEGQEATFHVDHVVPIAAGGQTVTENLALACVSCSLRKGARETAIDPITQTNVALFNPRKDKWSEHFRWDGVYLVGTSPIGRATVETLKMNREQILLIREEEALVGRHPSPRP